MSNTFYKVQDCNETTRHAVWGKVRILSKFVNPSDGEVRFRVQLLDENGDTVRYAMPENLDSEAPVKKPPKANKASFIVLYFSEEIPQSKVQEGRELLSRMVALKLNETVAEDKGRVAETYEVAITVNHETQKLEMDVLPSGKVLYKVKKAQINIESPFTPKAVQAFLSTGTFRRFDGTDGGRVN